MLKRNISLVLGLMIIASMILTSCQQTPLIQTVVVTQVVEKEGQTIIETQFVEVTPTPEPVVTETTAAVSPEFKNPDTYMVVTGAGEPESLDPAWTYETAGASVEANLYEGLVWFNRERTDDYVPALATDWTVSEDGKTWTFNIRKGVSFHEGGTLEPHDIAYTSARAMLQGRVDGPQWMTYEAFFGGDLAMSSVNDFVAAFSGKDTIEDVTPEEKVAACEAVKAAVVADDAAGTITYNLANNTPWFMALLAQNFLGGVLDQEWMVEQGDWDNDCATWEQWADPSAEESLLFNKANGTGPYKLDHWTPGEEIVLTANENYWRTEPMWEGGPSGVASIKNVVIKNINEWGTRLSMFESGDADWIYVPSTYRPQLTAYHGNECDASGNCTEVNPEGYINAWISLPSPAITPAQFNWNINVEGGNPYVGSGELDGSGIPADFFADLHIRRAFNYCFDFDALVKDALNNDGVQAQGPIPQGMMGYREGEAPYFSFDLAKCEEEFKLADLDKDGVAAGDDDNDVWSSGFYMQIAYNEGNDTRRVLAEILKNGIETVNSSFSVQVLALPWPVLLNSRTAGKLPIYIGGWLEDYHDPHNWVQPFLSPQGAYGRIVNMTEDYATKYDELIKQGASLTTVEERRPIYEQIQLMAQEDGVNLWAYQVLDREHFQKWIKNYYYNSAYGAPSYTWVYALSKEAP